VMLVFVIGPVLSTADCVTPSTGSSRAIRSRTCADKTFSLVNLVFQSLSSTAYGRAIFMQTGTIRGEFASLGFYLCTAQSYGGATQLGCQRWTLTRSCGVSCSVTATDNRNEYGGHFIATSGEGSSEARGVIANENAVLFCRNPGSIGTIDGAWNFDSKCVVELSRTNISDCYAKRGVGAFVTDSPRGVTFSYTNDPISSNFRC
jgi:hypothetical protein